MNVFNLTGIWILIFIIMLACTAKTTRPDEVYIWLGFSALFATGTTFLFVRRL